MVEAHGVHRGVNLWKLTLKRVVTIVAVITTLLSPSLLEDTDRQRQPDRQTDRHTDRQTPEAEAPSTPPRRPDLRGARIPDFGDGAAPE